MNTETMLALLMFLKPPRCLYKGGHKEISGSKMLAMTLNYLGSQTSIRHLARQFGVTISSFMYCTEKVMMLLMQKGKYVIKWPKKEDYAQIPAQFNKEESGWFCFTIEIVLFISNSIICLLPKTFLFLSIEIPQMLLEP